MLKFLIAIAVILGTAHMLLDASAQKERNAQQGVLLERMEAMNQRQVSVLVDEWRAAYPNPSDERLMELRVIAQRVKADPAAAEKLTAKHKQSRIDALGISSPFGDFKATPGTGL